MKAGRSQKRTPRGRAEPRQPSLHLPPDVLDRLSDALDWLRAADRELASRVEELAMLPSRNVLLLSPGGNGRVLVNPEAVRSVPARELAGLLARLVAFDLNPGQISAEAYRAERARLACLEARLRGEPPA